MLRHPQGEGGHRPNSSIRIGRRIYPVIGRLTIRRQTYLLLKRLSPAPRERYLAFNPDAQPGGALRAVHLHPHTADAAQHLQALARLPRGWPLPHLCHYDRHADQLRYALEWVEGIDLQAYLEKVRAGRIARPSLYEAVRLVRGLAHGLRTLNQHAQLIHGDLKPANLILTRKPSYLVMVDFGSAWRTEESAWRVSGDGYSSTYAAPELQHGSHPVNFRADQFSASVLLYELLTLRLPYRGLGGKAGRPEYSAGPPVSCDPPSEFLSDPGQVPIHIRKELDRVVLRGLTLDPRGRFSTSSEWLASLDALWLALKLPNTAVLHSPDPVGRLVDQFGRRFLGWK